MHISINHYSLIAYYWSPLLVALSQIDFKLLLCLNSLLAHRNVSRAADQMHMSQPAMSRALGKLRELFDDPLFVRTSQGMEPTTRAEALANPLQATLDQLSSLLISENFSPQLSQRNFKLHMSSYVSQAYLGDIAAAFYQQAPNAHLEVINLQEKSLIHQSSQSIDLAVASQQTLVPDYFHQLYLGVEQMCCFMSRNHPLSCSKLDLDGYLAYSHVVISLGGGPNMPVEEHLSLLGKSRKIGLRTPHFLSALEVVSKTQMLLNTTPLVPGKFMQQFDLICQKIPFQLPENRYYLSWPPSLHRDPGHQWLRGLCAKVIKENITAPDITEF
ncbi:MAG: LysR family transcriptional regulator [Pseudomonadales bacterium]|nr:LysR family transcriptional regulator [Pseudomonadales bacterium]